VLDYIGEWEDIPAEQLQPPFAGGAWMYKNAEGYRDETAWRAIIAVAREERIKRRKLQEDKNMGTENKTGEVWRTRTVTGTEKIVLVVADHGAMA
jgi:hypothetical protein